ncbi:transcription elongation factor S-II [Clonorchis sinensis]|uniref:Transcription elongation factor S-II n=1 Tax=Clonorchis sinensis TaxID=79923 RepID=G7YWP2_CLOSI|nr:transcription elongation factor S-II [Clonorchis sinensis]
MEETEKIARRLEKMLKSGNIVSLYVRLDVIAYQDEESALKYLKRLRGVEMTLDILTKTGVGIIINKIRKESGNSEIATLGKNIIKQWKKLVPGAFNIRTLGQPGRKEMLAETSHSLKIDVCCVSENTYESQA